MSIIWELISNAKIMGFTTDTLNQTLWGVEPSLLQPFLHLSDLDVPEV